MVAAYKVTPSQLGWCAAVAADKAGVLDDLADAAQRIAWTLANYELVAQEIEAPGYSHFGDTK